MSIKIPTLDKLYSFKEKLFTMLKIERPVRFMVYIGFTPNKITTLSILIGILSILYFLKNQTIFVLLFVTNRLLDILDGYMARKFNLKTNIGDKLDHWGDLAIHIGLLMKTIFISDLSLLGTIALFTYVGEYILLKKQGLLHQKFPSGMFAYIFIFGFYKFGLIYQIFYQIFSYSYFQLYLKKSVNGIV